MNSELKKHVFRTNINSVYQIFWVTHDILKICPNTLLYFDEKETMTKIFITNCILSHSQIQSIFIDNQIEFEKIPQ